jgi:hypothetical protein
MPPTECEVGKVINLDRARAYRASNGDTIARIGFWCCPPAPWNRCRRLLRGPARVKLSGQDAKWCEIESILDEPMMLDAASGLRRKILIFTEPRDTLDYLADKRRARIGESAGSRPQAKRKVGDRGYAPASDRREMVRPAMLRGARTCVLPM